MSEINLDDVKRLLDAATPGPWRAAGRIWMVVSESDRLLCDCIGDTDMGLREARANAALIAAAPTIAAAYIEQAATIARLTEERDRLREALEKIAGEQNVYKGHGNYDTEPACSAEDAQKIARDELSKKCSTLRT